MKIRQSCLIAPVLTQEEREALKINIQKNGLINPIVTYKGEILDGRHRFEICKELDIKPTFKEFELNGVKSEFDYVAAMLQGRNLNSSQRACYAIEYDYTINKDESDVRRSNATKAWHKAKREGTTYQAPHKTRDDLAKMFGASLCLVNYADILYRENKCLFLKAKNGGNLDVLYKEHRKNTPGKHKGGKFKIQQENIQETKISVKLPNPWDGMEAMNNFLREMTREKGWKFEMRVEDGKFYANFYGNGYVGFRETLAHLIPTNGLGNAIVQAGFERVGLIKE